MVDRFLCFAKRTFDGAALHAESGRAFHCTMQLHNFFIEVTVLSVAEDLWKQYTFSTKALVIKFNAVSKIRQYNVKQCTFCTKALVKIKLKAVSKKMQHYQVVPATGVQTYGLLTAVYSQPRIDSFGGENVGGTIWAMKNTSSSQ